MNAIKFEELFKKNDRYIYHNAWNLSKQQLELFSNRMNDKYKNINAATLCACSALPFIEGTVDIDGDTYCEGALVDTVNFENLIDDHSDLEEIWVSRIVDAKQVRKPLNLTDALSNLCQLFAATVGDDDVKLFEYHVQTQKGWKGIIVEICVDSRINFEWSHKNLEQGRERGRLAARKAIEAYHAQRRNKQAGKELIIRCEPPEKPVKPQHQAQPNQSRSERVKAESPV
jgi:predicted acylesterase/phospholipase RssA